MYHHINMVRHIPSKVVTPPSFLQRNAPRESFVILCLLIVSPQSLFHRLAGGFCTMAMKWFLAAFLVCCLEFHTLHIWGDKFDCNSAPIHPTWGLGGRCGKPCWGPQVGLMGHSSMSFSDQRTLMFSWYSLTMWKTWLVDWLVVANFPGQDLGGSHQGRQGGNLTRVYGRRDRWRGQGENSMTLQSGFGSWWVMVGWVAGLGGLVRYLVLVGGFTLYTSVGAVAGRGREDH